MSLRNVPIPVIKNAKITVNKWVNNDDKEELHLFYGKFTDDKQKVVDVLKKHIEVNKYVSDFGEYVLKNPHDFKSGVEFSGRRWEVIDGFNVYSNKQSTLATSLLSAEENIDINKLQIKPEVICWAILVSTKTKNQ